MKHAFKDSQIDKLKCAICKRAFMDHFPTAECESCGKKLGSEGEVLQPQNILMCDTCLESHKAAVAAHMSPENQAARIKEHHEEWTKRALENAQKSMIATLAEAKEIDDSLEIAEDIHNLPTVSITKIKDLIDADEKIVNKDWELARTLTARFQKFKKILFDNDNGRSVLNRDMRATHDYLNKLAERLTQDERKQLQIKDINYKPAEIKPVKEVKIKTAKFKVDMGAVKKYCAILAAEGLPIGVETLYGYCLQKQIDPEKGHHEMRRMIKEGRSMSK